MESGSKTPEGLNALQQWLQEAITAPWMPHGAAPEDVIRSDRPGLDPTERLRIYTRAYQGRLVECMQSEFPVLCHAMGADLFDRFASEYLVAHPPRSYTLTALGDRFPQHLRETRPKEEDGLWAEFLIELATLERTFSEVYHGAGPEGGGEHGNDTDSIRSEPGSRVLRCSFPLDDYFIAVRKHLKDEDATPPPELPQPDAVTLLIFRRNYVVQLRRIPVEAMDGADAERSP